MKLAGKEMKLVSENSSRFNGTQKRHQRLQEKSNKAFQRWLQASNEWVLARHKADRNSDIDNSAAMRQARKLEKRLDEAAEAYESARRKFLLTKR